MGAVAKRVPVDKYSDRETSVLDEEPIRNEKTIREIRNTQYWRSKMFFVH